ncbi:MAG: hypothetical protein OEY09_14505 [Gammaproteobacteria bacterium]|nr:hypothetical protein [Gammaproteobacteria bacterium]
MIPGIHRYLTAIIFSLILGGTTTTATAAESQPILDKNRFSIGVGISDNSVSGPGGDETGYQLFGAYELDQVNVMDGVNSSLEFGYMDYGYNRDSDGIWGTYVVDGLISANFGWLARIGMDIGDDNGLMFGAGASFAMNANTALRVEYVIRDDIDSLQFNLLFGL